MTIKNFFDLDAWKSGHEFAVDIYKVTIHFPAPEKYGIVSQIRRSATSIAANIAEGFSRYHYKDKIRFYFNARGSISESQNHLLFSKEMKFIAENDFDACWAKAETCRKLLNGLIRSTAKQYE